MYKCLGSYHSTIDDGIDYFIFRRSNLFCKIEWHFIDSFGSIDNIPGYMIAKPIRWMVFEQFIRGVRNGKERIEGY